MTKVLLYAGPDPSAADTLQALGIEVLLEAPPTLREAAISAAVLTDDAGAQPRDVVAALAGESIPVLYVDHRGDGAARAGALAAGCEDVIVGPLDPGELRTRLDAMARRSAEGEAMLRANETLRELAEKKRMLAALVVHDLRNPLTAIQGNLQLVDEIVTMTDPVALRAMRDLHELAGHTLTLVASLLDVEELEEGILSARPSDVDVDELLAKTSRHQRAVIEFRKLTLEKEVAQGLHARLDPTLVGRVVENLIDNAVRYAPSGGRVVLRADKDGGAAVIRVLNSGPPIPVDKRDAIFDRFFSVKARREGVRANRGLGLYFCKLAAQAHGGTIAVVPGPADLPACFELRLPQ